MRNENVEKQVEEKKTIERKEEEDNEGHVHLNGRYQRKFQKENREKIEIFQ